MWHETYKNRYEIWKSMKTAEYLIEAIDIVFFIFFLYLTCYIKLVFVHLSDLYVYQTFHKTIIDLIKNEIGFLGAIKYCKNQ